LEVPQIRRVRGESNANFSLRLCVLGFCGGFFCCFFFFFKSSFKMNLGKLEGEFTWYLRDFLCFTNILSFLLKKTPLGCVKGRREKVKPRAHLLWRKSGPIPLISVEPLWICRGADEQAPSARGACAAAGRLARWSGSRKSR